MSRVSTTASFMRGWTRPQLDPSVPGDCPGRLGVWGLLTHWYVMRALCGWMLCLSVLVVAAVAHADQEPAPEPTATVAVAVQRSTEGLFITARLPLEIGPAVEDALFKAVPVYFVYQAEVREPRWYWTDKRIATATRTLRLAYQPLTRRWRLSAAPGLVYGSAQQYALHQNFETLSEAVASLGRLARWRIADGTRLEEGERYSVSFRFRLDLSLLPRPFQIGMATQPDWNIDVVRELRTTAHAEVAEGAAPVATEAAGDGAR